MKPAELRLLPDDELISQLRAAQREYGLYHESVLTGKEKNHARLNGFRRQVARLKTICRTRNLAVS